MITEKQLIKNMNESYNRGWNHAIEDSEISCINTAFGDCPNQEKGE